MKQSRIRRQKNIRAVKDTLSSMRKSTDIHFNKMATTTKIFSIEAIIFFLPRYSYSYLTLQMTRF